MTGRIRTTRQARTARDTAVNRAAYAAWLAENQRNQAEVQKAYAAGQAGFDRRAEGDVMRAQFIYHRVQCAWCDLPATGSARHNSGYEFASCGHGLEGTYIAADWRAEIKGEQE